MPPRITTRPCLLIAKHEILYTPEAVAEHDGKLYWNPLKTPSCTKTNPSQTGQRE